ncbi:MAG: DUF72 domain-containing protein [Methanobacterium sp.]|jgi:uncharacterized protein YecE (DUF72 family)
MKSNYFLGCSGWYYKDWKGRFYPERLDESKWLEYYSRHFNTVEINNTFYRFPNEKIVKGWYNRTPEDFKITLKVNQLITHRKRFKDTQSAINRFYNLADILEDKLGCILFQFPPNILKNIAFLKNAIKQFDPVKNNIVEFRHPGWFDSEVYSLLSDFEIGFCSVSSPELPEDIITTSDTVYMRFHGIGSEKYRYFYSKEELKGWADKIRKLDVEDVFCYFNNDYNANAPQNCIMLKEILENL